MPHIIAPDIHVAPFGDRAVVLDVAHNRYRMLQGDPARLLSDIVAGAAVFDAAALARLVELGLLVWSPQRRAAIQFTRPTRTALEEEGESFPVSTVQILMALTCSMAGLRLLGFAGMLQTIKRRIPASGMNHLAGGDAAALARGYARSRSGVPIRSVCLRDCLALMGMLARRRIRASLVFGVRLDPFVAHCWVQQADLLLTDSLQLIGEYRPIFVL